MDFATAWTTLKVGDHVKVRDGKPPVSKKDGVDHKAWKSHNHKGTLEAKKTVGGWRYLRVALDADERSPDASYVAYDIADGGPHNFEVLD